MKSKIQKLKIFNLFGKCFLSLTLLCISTTWLLAQDTITVKGGIEILAKVLEVGTSEVKYIRPGTTSPIYSLLKSEILVIKYENGGEDIFNPQHGQTSMTFLATPSPAYKYTFGNTINPVGGKKSAWGSGIASFFIPGLGQFINGDVGGGLLFLGCNITCNVVLACTEDDSVALIAFISSLVVNVIRVTNAAVIAQRVNVARGYKISKNSTLKVEPTILQANTFAKQSTNKSAYGLSLRIAF